MPLWLATLLVKKGYVHMDMPKMFNKRSREHLDAGAASVNLREKSPQYFTVGIELARFKITNITLNVCFIHVIHAYILLYCIHFFLIFKLMHMIMYVYRIKKDDDLQKKLLTAFTAERFRDIMDLAFNRFLFTLYQSQCSFSHTIFICIN